MLKQVGLAGSRPRSSCGRLRRTQSMPTVVRGTAKTLPGLRYLLMAGRWTELGHRGRLVAFPGRGDPDDLPAG